MQDRNVEFPNRFRMVKVEGTDDIYDMIPAPGDVLNPGTLLNKANLLTDEVAQKMGLAMADPRPIDMFGVLADAGNIHVWAFVDSSGNKDFRVSVNRNAYQEGTSGGTTITYLGQLGDKVQIEVGSYVGTGTYGASNPTSITVGFAPKLLIITPASQISSQYSVTWFAVYTAGRNNIYAFNSRTQINEPIFPKLLPVTVTDAGISWHSDSADDQMNTSGTSFYYSAIG